MAEDTIVEDILGRLAQSIHPAHVNKIYFVHFFKRVLVYKTIQEQFKDFSLDKHHIEAMRAFVDKHEKIQEVERLIKDCFTEIPIQIAKEIDAPLKVKPKIPAAQTFPLTVVSSLFCLLFVYLIFPLNMKWKMEK